jgi:ACS family hexuronate transporter-like MFS transporter
MAVQGVETTISEAPKGLGFRWTIVALLLFATTINYIDRQVLGILAPTIQRELHWSETDYGDISAAFSFAYGIGYLIAGPLMDRIGVKLGYSLAIIIWSCAAMSTSLAQTAKQFLFARAGLGFGESGNFPGALKATAEWFPKKERALATGIFNAGSNVGAIVAPMFVPVVALNYGWRPAFLCTGILSLIWVATWYAVYDSPEKHKRVTPQELAHIRSDPGEAESRVPYLTVLKHRQAWAFILGKFFTDPVWWFYLFWLPKFLDANFGVKLSGLAAPLIVIYLVADIGSIYGGYLSSAIIKRGSTVNRGRKMAMLIAATLIVPTMFVPHMSTMWGAVLLVALAASSHQWWSANLFTTASDMFPRRAVATVVGFGGFAGAMGGVLFQKTVGYLLQRDPTAYRYIFMFCGLIYLTTLLIMHLIVPRMEPARIE